ncbi:MAG: hypothetical protein AAGG57_08085 [Pseudomonadota bacterium]
MAIGIILSLLALGLCVYMLMQSERAVTGGATSEASGGKSFDIGYMLGINTQPKGSNDD